MSLEQQHLGFIRDFGLLEAYGRYQHSGERGLLIVFPPTTERMNYKTRYVVSRDLEALDFSGEIQEAVESYWPNGEAVIFLMLPDCGKLLKIELLSGSDARPGLN